MTPHAVRLQLEHGKSFELHGPADITKAEVDAIVNAANSSLLGGGGVDGAIHRTGGPSILAECRRIAAEIGQLSPGKAVITTAGRLAAKYVIHTVGPIYRGGGRGEANVLRSCYQESIRIADEHDIRSIAFPSVSTGAFGYPIRDMCDVPAGEYLLLLALSIGAAPLAAQTYPHPLQGSVARISVRTGLVRGFEVQWLLNPLPPDCPVCAGAP